MPRTSVIITSYNYERFLRQAIESVLAQSDGDFELLIVDDGSTDRSVAIARGYPDPRLRVLEEPHRGIGATRNAGIRAAAGRYLALLDADDLWLPGKLAAQAAILDRYPEVGLVYARFGIVDAAAQPLAPHRSWLHSKPSGNLLRRLLAGNVIGTPSTVMLRHDLVRRENLWFDESGEQSEDWHFYLRVALHAEMRYSSRLLGWRRQHSRNFSRHVPVFMGQTLRTAEFAQEVAGRHLNLSGRELGQLKRAGRAYAEALAAREYAKLEDLAHTRSHAWASLANHPWSAIEIALFACSSLGRIPRPLRRRLH